MSKTFGGVSSDVIDVGGATALNLGSTYTICGWIYPTGGGGGNFGRIYTKTTNSGLYSSFFFINDVTTGTNAVDMNGPNFATATGGSVSSDNSVPQNTWSYVAGSFVAGDGGPRLWIGSLATPVAEASYRTRGAESGALTGDNTSNAKLGNRGDGTRNFAGRLAHVSIWDNVLTLAHHEQLRMLPRAVRHRFTTGGTVINLKGYWPLDESVASTCLDHSGNGLTGTVTGTTVDAEPPQLRPLHGALDAIYTITPAATPGKSLIGAFTTVVLGGV